jgi:hypothetical protein
VEKIRNWRLYLRHRLRIQVSNGTRYSIWGKKVDAYGAETNQALVNIFIQPPSFYQRHVGLSDAFDFTLDNVTSLKLEVWVDGLRPWPEYDVGQVTRDLARTIQIKKINTTAVCVLDKGKKPGQRQLIPA